MLVRLEDDVQDRRDLLLSTTRRRVEQVRGERDEDPERLLDDSRQDLGLLTEPKPVAELRVSQQPESGYTRGRRRMGGRRGKEKKGAHRNARTISSTTTVPAPTSRMLLLARRALAPLSNSGHFSGKSYEMSDLSVLASWTVITREGDAARSGSMLLFRAVRSVGKIGLKSGPTRAGSAP
jgi:hypothetical protein